MKILVEKGGADVSIKNEDGKTALDWAKDEKKTDVVAYLTLALESNFNNLFVFYLTLFIHSFVFFNKDNEYISPDNLSDKIRNGIPVTKLYINIYRISHDDLSRLISIIMKSNNTAQYSTTSLILKDVNMENSEIDVIQMMIEFLKKMPGLKTLSIMRCHLLFVK